MISIYKYSGITWVDLQSPSPDELIRVFSECKIPKNLVNIFSKNNNSSRIENYDNTIYLSLNFPIIHTSSIHREYANSDLEVIFILGKDFIITSHKGFKRNTNNVIRDLKSNLSNRELNKTIQDGYLLYSIILEAYDHVEKNLNSVCDFLNYIGGHLGVRDEKMIDDVSNLSKEFLNFKKTMRINYEVLGILSQHTTKLYGNDFSKLIDSIRTKHEGLIKHFDSEMLYIIYRVQSYMMQFRLIIRNIKGDREEQLMKAVGDIYRDINNFIFSTNKKHKLLFEAYHALITLILIIIGIEISKYIAIINKLPFYVYATFSIIIVIFIIFIRYKIKKWRELGLGLR